MVNIIPADDPPAGETLSNVDMLDISLTLSQLSWREHLSPSHASGGMRVNAGRSGFPDRLAERGGTAIVVTTGVRAHKGTDHKQWLTSENWKFQSQRTRRRGQNLTHKLCKLAFFLPIMNYFEKCAFPTNDFGLRELRLKVFTHPQFFLSFVSFSNQQWVQMILHTR